MQVAVAAYTHIGLLRFEGEAGSNLGEANQYKGQFTGPWCDGPCEQAQWEKLRSASGYQ